MTAGIPLIAHRSPSHVVAYCGGVAVPARRFLADARALASRLPSGRHVLNVCADRYRFTVGFAACLLSGRASLLPSSHTPEVIRRLAAFAPDVFCLTDRSDCRIDLPQMRFPALPDAARPEEHAEFTLPEIPAAQTAAIVFTSGSTGLPLPHHKTWGKLAACCRAGAAELGLSDDAVHTLVGTVPAQHMYGFESTVLLALTTGNAFSASHPFYPLDICAAVAEVPRPRALISTPVHLRALLHSAVRLPALDLIVSATAPLDARLARDAEQRYGVPLLEIYGSTETGQLATRRTAAAAAWRLWPGVRLAACGDQVFAEGGHVESRTALSDVVELIDERQFLLHGRSADAVNIAGKRSSIGYLNAQLNALPGVLDGAFFVRTVEPRPGADIVRLAAAVVAPTLTAAALLEALRTRIDAVFLPRPLLLVDRLPRNATGKLPQQALHELLAGHTGRGNATRYEELYFAPEHAAFAGHFPGNPVLPGAMLLDAVLDALTRSRGLEPTRWQLAATKFLEPVRPGATLTLEHTAPDPATVRFSVRAAGSTVASGTLQAVPPCGNDP